MIRCVVPTWLRYQPPRSKSDADRPHAGGVKIAAIVNSVAVTLEAEESLA